MKKSHSFITVLICYAAYLSSYKVNAQNCPIGWPVIIAPDRVDGDTEVNVWIESPGSISFDEFIIAGRSTSTILTEQDDSCGTSGCVFIVRWKKIGGIFEQFTIVDDVNAAVDIQYDASTNIGAFLYLQLESSNVGYYVLQFNMWDEKEDQLVFGEVAYIIKKEVDLTVYNDFTNVMINQEGLIYMISNDPDRETIYNYWMILETTDDLTQSLDQQTTISEFYESDLETDGGYFKGAPTRQYSMGVGYDTDNVLILASLTYPKGEQEFGGGTILGAATNYMVIISRTMEYTGTPFAYDNNGVTIMVPFTFQDQVYGVQQVSPALFYYYTHFTLAYITNVQGFYKSDVYMHLAGVHTSKTKEIYLSTYIVRENHSLDHQYTRIFTADGTVEILGTNTKDTTDVDELWVMYVFYQETSISNRGKMMYTNMELSFEVVSFYFQEEQAAIDRNPMTINLRHFRYLKEDGVFIWGGTANYVAGYGDESSLTFSWMETRRKFGFFTVWTTDENCYTEEDKEALSWGPRYQQYLDGLDEFVIKEREVFLDLRPPNSQWNMGDLDDENFDDLEREQKKIDEDGFMVVYKSWRYYDEDEREELYNMHYIDGDNWVDRFNKRQTAQFKGQSRAGSLSIMALGVWGLGQVGLAVALWYAFLDAPVKNHVVDSYWGSWVIIFGLLIGFEGGLFLVWPTSYYGTSLSLDFAYGVAAASLTGPYGLYEVCIFFLMFTMWFFPVSSGYDPVVSIFGGDLVIDKITWFIVAIVDLGINSFMSLWFTPDVKKYRDAIKALEEAEEQAEAAKLDDDSNFFDIGGE